MEEKIWVVILQYGALALIAVYLGYKDFVINRNLLEVLTDIKEAFNISVAQNKTLEDSIAHERKRSEECYEKIVARLDDYYQKIIGDIKKA